MPDPPVIPFPADSTEPLSETHGSLTNVMTFESGQEQRVQLRAVALESIEYSILCSPDSRRPGESSRAQAFLEGLLYAHQPDVVAVPMWQFGVRLTANVSIGATSIPAVTDSIPFREGDYVLVWSDPFTWELLTIDTISPTAITTTDTTTKAWVSGKTLVLPVRLARLQDRITVTRRGRAISQARLRFSVEATAAAEPAVPTTGLPTYLDLDVLEIELQREPATDETTRRIYMHDNETGARSASSPVAVPTVVRAARWLCFSREESAVMRSFVDSHRGRAVPFWLLTREDDLELASPETAGSDEITILECGYTARMFTTDARRHVAIRALRRPRGCY
jgi:hypothetical protein